MLTIARRLASAKSLAKSLAETLSKTFGETLSETVLPRVFDWIRYMTLGKTFFETRFFTRETKCVISEATKHVITYKKLIVAIDNWINNNNKNINPETADALLAHMTSAGMVLITAAQRDTQSMYT